MLGMKFDDGKLSYSLLDRAALAWTVATLTYGAVKYERNNWKNVEEWPDRYYDAAMRHLEAWRGGERYDPENGLPHLAAAACCVHFLLGLSEPDVSILPAKL